MSNDTQVNQYVELTQEGLEELKAELAELTTNRLPRIVERVAEARDKGDLSENADYQSARDEQSFIQAKIEEIEEVIARAKIVKATSNHDKVGMGSVVSVQIKGKTAKTFTYHIVGEFESEPEEGKVSSVSPMGKALMGKKKGDEVVVEAPAGEVVYVIKDIK
ncbi:MAG: transcription elongation factor GreA [Patescibacteria group bacterium]